MPARLFLVEDNPQTTNMFLLFSSKWGWAKSLAISALLTVLLLLLLSVF